MLQICKEAGSSLLKSGNKRHMVSKFIIPWELAFICYRHKSKCHKANCIIHTTQYIRSL